MWRPVLLADMAICNEWFVEVAIALYDKYSQPLWYLGKLDFYSWALPETQLVLLDPQVRIPGNTCSYHGKCLLCLRSEEHL